MYCIVELLDNLPKNHHKYNDIVEFIFNLSLWK